MAVPWFRVDVEVVDHPKIHHLETLVGERAGWYLIRLWAWTARYASRGRLANVARASLERSCGWTGDAGRLVAAFIESGLLDETTTDELEVHDWWEKQGAVVEKAEKDRERLKASRVARGIVARTSRDAREVVAGDVTVRDGTVRNDTSSPAQRSKHKEKASKPVDPRHAPLVARLVATFEAVKQTPYPFNGGRDAKAVTLLLAKAEPDVIDAAWARALREATHPPIASIFELEPKLAHFVGAPAGKVLDLRKPVPAATFTETRIVEDF